ncbi:LysR family transcriptional regulator [Paenibacillus radicis (ex Gao et al. 2016)]|uniref:HTH-type transcriptional regulator BsdA n=1 Tax=Paenibacillus radicis (ex Gao et al. 2016) TaxID=1737354 RepID=A0A917LWL7_9BACL|nr:LysR family transcriptional regulator [Paenibacillus radicis (ex Gao et al. 2016)]GGG63669.1 HTH-type transcriptional regulator BsdA [Paenibacillus radicis (ex Gao et al. 2016)]
MGLDLRQLRYFIAITEEGGITAAAKKLHMAQPPLSQQLKKMENELGVQLIHRIGKTIELTDAGKTLYRQALKITKEMEECQKEVQETGQGVRGKLTIGINTLSDARLPELMLRYKQQFPNITYKIQQNESSQLCRLVRSREIELAIVRLPLELSEFSVLHLQGEPFYFVTSDPSGLEGKPVNYRTIEPYPLMLPSTEGLGIYHRIIEQFASVKITPRLLGECSDIALLMEFVSTGFASSIVPATVLKLHHTPRIHAYEIEVSPHVSTSGLIWLKDHYLSQAGRHFINLVSELH